jgi:hypothetical protein|nr:MAG TPA: hypothetical protein [Caudoviricetes sp.]
MALINFIVGKKSSYVQDTYPYGVYFATDTHEIIFQGITYGMSTSFKAVKSVDISGTTMTITYTDGSESTTITLNKSMVGLGNVDNTSDANKPVSTAQQQAINAVKSTVDGYTINGKKISSNPTLAKGDVGLSNVTNDAQVKRSEMGVANGVATLDERGKIPVSQLDGQMARVFGIEKAVASSTNLPSDGVSEGDRYYVIDTKKIYERLEDSWDGGTDPKEDTIYNFRLTDATGSSSRTNILYRWDGKSLVEISASLALGETSGTAYEGSKGKQNATDIASLKGKVSALEGLNIDATYAKKTEALGTNINWAAGTNNATLTFHTLSGTNKVVTLTLASTAAAGLMSKEDKAKLESLNNYSLPLAASGVRGGIQIGYAENGKNYAVKLNSEKAYVSVPWTDQNVLQNAVNVANGEYNVLLAGTAGNTEQETKGVQKGNGITYNPSTKTLTAVTFKGNLSGNATSATSATKATQDASGNVITATYAKQTDLSSLQTRVAALESALTLIEV